MVYSDEIYHYGVKGMKWGVRRKKPTSYGKAVAGSVVKTGLASATAAVGSTAAVLASNPGLQYSLGLGIGATQKALELGVGMKSALDVGAGFMYGHAWATGQAAAYNALVTVGPLSAAGVAAVGAGLGAHKLYKVYKNRKEERESID